MQVENKLTRNFIIGTFVTLYVMVSLISTIHVIDFFELSNPKWLAVTLAVAFEVGAAASLASIIALKKMNKGIVWALFFILTAMQAMGNAFFAYTHLNNYQSWVELFGLVDSDPIEQKRILSIVSGAILPLVALGFIKSLVDYIRPEDQTITTVNDQITDSVTQTQITDAVTQSNLNDEAQRVWEKVNELRKEGKLPEITEEDLENEPTALAFTPYENNEDMDDDFEEDSLIDMQINPESIEEVIEEEQKSNGLGLNFEEEFAIVDENPSENDPENYPVYDKTNQINNNGIENIMVFTKDGGQ
jgi:hypothetical protein